MDAPALVDAHCHLGLMSDGAAFAAGCAAAGLEVFDCGVNPRDTYAARRRDAACPGIIPGAGLHPWWIADGRCSEDDVALLCEQAERERFIGEVGLDFSPRFAGSEQAQQAAFERLCRTLAKRPLPGRIVSIHAVRAAGTVLDILDGHGLLKAAPDSPAVVFHWFSGTSDDFARARGAGCFFSVGERMLKTRRGREYARQIPLGQLLLETDAPEKPAQQPAPMDIRASLARAAAVIAELKGTDAPAIIRATTATWHHLIA